MPYDRTDRGDGATAPSSRQGVPSPSDQQRAHSHQQPWPPELRQAKAPAGGRHMATGAVAPKPATEVEPISRTDAWVEASHTGTFAPLRTPSRPMRVDPGLIPEIPPEDPLMQDVSDAAPRPIGVDPEETGSFSTLGEGEGAVISTRHTAGWAVQASRDDTGQLAGVNKRLNERRRPQVERKERPIRVNRKLFLGIAIAAVIVIVAGVVLFNRVVDSAAHHGQAPQTSQAQNLGIDQQVKMGDVTYQLQRNADGTYGFMRSVPGGQPTQLFQLSGTPVSIAVIGDVAYVPESLADGTWDILCYVMADSSQVAQLLDADGNPVVGKGTLASAEAQEGTLVLTMQDGQQTRIALT